MSIFVFSYNTYANDIEIFYAGVSYLGDSQYITKSYPFTSKINENLEGQFVLDKLTREIVKQTNNPLYSVNTNSLADLNNENQLTMTLAISSESTSIEQIDDSHRLWIQVLAQVFIFDFKKMQIVANQPIALSYVEVYPEAPSEELILNVFREQFFSQNSLGMLELSNALSRLKLNNSGKNTVQVASVKISDAALQVIPTTATPKEISQKAGENFTQFLSSNQGITMLPFVKGHAVGNKLAGKFSDGRVYSLELPEPDYAIDIEVTHFVKKIHDTKSAGTSWIYVARGRFRFYEPLSGQNIFEEYLFNGITKIIPASQKNIVEWPVYQESLFLLFDQFTKQIDIPDRNWLSIHAQSSDKFKELKKLKEVIESCR
ncbi:hypothetical protein [Shewanella baltica]|uniref:hypothetical protein n=1 Tax=Shewanella baltica TaxID=62322 RepID=UPI0012FC179E|nr:hypothetical protein [Shewanella baltica]MCS6173241.1 hypothetical protein [Shewanella baltica]MCS6239871.1 hypothetical protein [Shewanella baltica]